MFCSFLANCQKLVFKSPAGDMPLIPSFSRIPNLTFPNLLKYEVFSRLATRKICFRFTFGERKSESLQIFCPLW